MTYKSLYQDAEHVGCKLITLTTVPKTLNTNTVGYESFLSCLSLLDH